MGAYFTYSGRFEIKRALISETTIGNRTLVSAVANKKLVVLSVVLIIKSPNTVVWKSGTTALSGALAESYAMTDDETGQLETALGEALIITTTSTDLIAGYLTYAEVP